MSGEDLKKYRTTQQLNQRELAKLIDVTQGTINRWENGSIPITGPSLKLLNLLFRNIHPFAKEGSPSADFRHELNSMELTMEEFEDLCQRAHNAGFKHVRDFLRFMVRNNKPTNVTPINYKNIPDPPTTKVAESAK